MVCDIRGFDAIGRTRIAQLINKSNQFNLTTRRYTEADVRAMEEDPDIFAMQIRLTDRFGDNGMISVVIFRKGDRGLDLRQLADELPRSGPAGRGGGTCNGRPGCAGRGRVSVDRRLHPIGEERHGAGTFSQSSGSLRSRRKSPAAHDGCSSSRSILRRICR